MQLIQMFSLSSKQSDPGLFCEEGELSLGGVPLIVKTLSGLKLRSVEDLVEIFGAAYGFESGIDLHSRLSCLQSLVGALNKDDGSYAMMLALMLRLPNIEDFHPAWESGLTVWVSTAAAKTTELYWKPKPRVHGFFACPTSYFVVLMSTKTL